MASTGFTSIISSGDLRTQIASGEDLSGMFVDEHGRLLLSWPTGDFEREDGLLAPCNTICIISLVCAPCAPCICCYVCDQGHMEYLALEPADDGMLSGMHYKGMNYQKCPCGQSPAKSDIRIGSVKIDVSEDKAQLQFLTSADQSGDPCVTMNLNGFLKDDGTAPHELYPGSEKNYKINAAYGILAAVESLIAGEKPSYDQHPASCVSKDRSSGFAWNDLSAADFQRWFNLGHKEHSADGSGEEDKTVISSRSPKSCLQQILCDCLCISLCCPLCIGCIADSIATRRDRTFVISAIGGAGDGVRLDVYEAPRFHGPCPLGLPRIRGSNAPRRRGGYRVTHVETNKEGILVFTSQLAVFSMKCDKAVALKGSENINAILTKYGRSTYGVDRDDGIAAKPIQQSMKSASGLKGAITRNQSHCNVVEENPDLTEDNVVASGPSGASIGKPAQAATAPEEPPQVSIEIEVKTKAKLIRDLLKAFSNDEVEKAVQSFVAARGTSIPPTVQQLSAAMCAIGMLRMSTLATMLNKYCSGPFPSSLAADAINATVKTRERAEGIATSMAPYVKDPDQFEALVIDGTILRSISLDERKKIMSQIVAVPHF